MPLVVLFCSAPRRRGYSYDDEDIVAPKLENSGGTIVDGHNGLNGIDGQPVCLGSLQLKKYEEEVYNFKEITASH